MEIVRCSSGHFYDKEQSPNCPICEKLNPPNSRNELSSGMGFDMIPGGISAPPINLPPLSGVPVPDDVSFTPFDERKTVKLPKGTQVYLEDVNFPRERYAFSLSNGQEFTLGRSRRANYVLNNGDDALSGVHCAFLWNSECLNVKDLNSTNGTSCDGMELVPQVYCPVGSGSTLHIGRHTYRIAYTEVW